MLRPRDWARLEGHLFGQGGEHGAILLARVVDGPRGVRLLGDQLLLAEEGKDYVPGVHGHRALTAEFVRDAALRARRDGLAYLALHNHGGTTEVAFSQVDMASHERGYPAIGRITKQVVGAVVCTPYAAAGDLWLPDGSRVPLGELVVPGSALRRLRPNLAQVMGSSELFDRQSRLFGAAGQACFADMRVAIVGQGGVGSLLTEYLARLGVGSLLLIDGDNVESTNLPRLLGARRRDVGRPKVALGRRNARRANPSVEVKTMKSRVEHSQSLQALSQCDWVFLAADSHAARHWVNAIVETYLIPATEVGVMVPVDDAGDVGRIHTVYRRMTPGQGCFWCNGLIDATELAIEMLPDAERKAARYIEDVPAPSVITLNAVAAGQAATDFMLAVTDLHQEEVADQQLQFVRTGQTAGLLSRQDPDCRWCGDAGLPTDASLATRIASADPRERAAWWSPRHLLQTVRRRRTEDR
uniref:ThiF family adenylyltransferase n=1 Tax=Nocardioides sp. Root682 TaxID=1736586 RepID=UPI000A6D5C71|nr:ThiF family adenylyltransferase [Nocardioides sp. Root682]